MIVGLLQCYAMFDKGIAMDMYPICNQVIAEFNFYCCVDPIVLFPTAVYIALQTRQCNGIGSTKMRVTANYDARYSKLSVCCKYSIRFEFGIFSGILFGVYIWVKGSHQIKYKYY